jgi:hypothetical protein
MTSPSRTRRRVLALGCIGFLAALAAAGAGLAAWRLGPRALVRPSSSGPPHVRIVSPAPESSLRVMDQTEVIIDVQSAEAIPWIELWVDGQRTALHQKEDAADSSASARFLWRAPGPGTHVLIARAGDSSGRIGQSLPRLVEALSHPPGPRLVRLDGGQDKPIESLAETYGLSPDAIRAANPEASGELPAGEGMWIPIPYERLPDGYLGDDSVSGEALAPVASESGPAAGPAQPAAIVPDAGPRLLFPGMIWEFGSPHLPEAPIQLEAGSQGNCRVELEFSDASLAETGFRVYRFSQETADFRRVADLAADRRTDRLAFEDSVPFAGRHLYYVASVNAWGETPSPMLAIDVTPADCPSEESASAGRSLTLKLEILSLTTSPALAYDSAYCYLSLSFSGGGHVRLPAGEDRFFAAQGEGWDIADHAAGDRGFPFTQLVDEPFTTGLSCWAWQGRDLIDLGEFEASHPPDEWRAALPQEFRGRGTGPAGGGFEAVYRLSPFVPGPLSVPMDFECLYPCNPDYPSPYDLGHPDSPEDCQAHADFSDGNRDNGAWAAPWACADIPVEHLWIWEWDPSEDLTRSMLTGFSVYTFPSLAAWREFDWEWQDTVGSAAQVMPISHFPSCGQTYIYAVRATWTETSDDGSMVESRTWYSPAVSIEGSPCPRGATILFHLVSLTVSDVLDVDGLEALCFFCDEDRTFEGYGQVTISVRDPEQGETYDVGRWILWGDACSTDGGIGVCPSHTRSVRDGRIDFEDETRLTSCENQGLGGPMRCSSNATQRMRIGLPIYTGQEIWVRFALWDEDGATGDDVFCRGEHTTGRVTVQDHRDDVGEPEPFNFLNDDSDTGTECLLALEREYLVIYPAEEG